MIASLLVAVFCIAAIVVVFRFGPAVVARHGERLAGWDDRLAGPDLVRFPSAAATRASAVSAAPRADSGARIGGTDEGGVQ